MSNARYGRVTQAIHWLTAALVLLAFVLGPGGPENRVYLHSRDFSRQWHETLGVCVIALTVLRILWKLFMQPRVDLGLPRLMELAARAVQGLLYLLLLAVPLSAVSGAWLEGHAVDLLGGVSLSSPLAPAHALGMQISELHGWLGDLIIWLAGGHAVVAIYHHWFLRDGTLRAMLPDWIGRHLPVRG